MCLIVQKRPSIIFPNFSNCCWYCKRKYINILLVKLKVLTKGNCLDFDGANKSLNCQIYLLFSFFIVVSLEKYINSNPWRSFFCLSVQPFVSRSVYFYVQHIVATVCCCMMIFTQFFSFVYFFFLSEKLLMMIVLLYSFSIKFIDSVFYILLQYPKKTLSTVELFLRTDI